MPQKTNLNISPYFDDFDKANNFYKVLFKPGFPVQARELSTLQSILQDQVESFGSHMFKEGSMVIPGNISYDPEYYSIKLNDEHLGVPISLYIQDLVGKRLKGQNSGTTVVVDKAELAADGTDITHATLFVKYVSGTSNANGGALDDGEALLTQEAFAYGNTVFNEGDSVVTLISLDASAVGCAAAVGDGVYFIRGAFVNVSADKIVLDPYSNTPSYRVGLSINEELITSRDDDSLYDNAKGFSNYAAPGADRLKITTMLSKKALTDNNDKTFVEILRLNEGEIRKLENKPQYNLIRDYFASRTFDESGDYTVNGFGIQVANSLNDGLSNEGVFSAGSTTDEGNVPTDDLMAVKVSSGKAYVRGYDTYKPGTTVVDVDKPRDIKKIEGALVPLELGNKIKVNNVQGTPFIGLNNNHTVDLCSERRATGTAAAAAGDIIGKARAYSFSLSDAPYNNASSDWDLYCFDVQTYTNVILNSSCTSAELPASSYIEGLHSGATGYTVAAGANANTEISIEQTSGTFLAGEPIKINGDVFVQRSLKSVRIFGIQDVKSVYQNTGGSGGILDTNTVDFAADTTLQRVIPKGFNVTDQLVINSAGITSCAGQNFAGIKSDTIIRYQRPNSADEVFNKVRWVSPDGLTMDLDAVATVAGVCNGAIPATGQETVSFSVGRPNIVSNENAGLYAPLSSSNVSDIDLAGSTLLVSKQITGEGASSVGLMEVPISSTGISSAFYENYDSERYSVHYSTLVNGSFVAPLSSDQFSLNADGTQISITGLSGNAANIVVNTTVKKKDIKSKQKNYVRSEKITIDKCVSAGSTNGTGLTQNNFYGLRVDDKEISLHVPDVAEVVGVFESLDTNVPILDKLSFVTGLGLDTNSILGEKIVGSDSKAVAQLTTRVSATEVEICYLTPERFKIGESLTFKESNIITNLQDKTPGSYLNITEKFTLDKGQKEQFYDYSRIVRNGGFSAPSRKITVVYNCYQVPSNDTGDVYTIDSYGKEQFDKHIPILKNGVRASDTLDFRPRVADWTLTTASPFAYGARNFGTAGSNPTLIVTPNESSLLGYSFYLPRIDKVILDKQERLSVIKGVSSIDPKPPTNVEDAMTLATIELPAYLYDPDDAYVRLVDNRRYTMRDIGHLEDRLDVLETVTSLSLLELDTKTLQVQDADGLSRFKTGFFVDDFKNTDLIDTRNRDNKCDVNTRLRELTTPNDFFAIKPELALNPSINSDTADFSANLELLDSNVRKTGDMLTLDYKEVELLKQPLASRTENVNPFNIIEFTGLVTLNPASDSWVRNVFIANGERTVLGDVEGSFVTEIRNGSRPDEHIRSRNVGFEANGLQPFTRYYPFFDSTSGLDIIPKLIEISMTSGVFESGETVEGFLDGQRVITFRICQPNHKAGDISAPDITFLNNPYNTSVNLSSAYSASASVLNVDIASLREDAQGRFFGYITSDISLLGVTSGAQATVSDIRLITDTYGDVYGSFFFRDPLATPPPPLRFRNGSRTFKLSSSETNSLALPGSPSISSGETVYTTSGVVDEFLQETISIRNPPPPPIPIINNITNVTNEITEVNNITNVTQVIRRDPLAQTFVVEGENGVFLSSVDLFFAKKDTQEKVHIEIRTTELGTPTDRMIVDYALISLEPTQVNVSDDASVPTRVTFPSPIYLPPEETYAVVILAPTTNNYEMWIAEMGEPTIDTFSLPNTESVIISKQYLGGSLFKSQNGSIWSANQFQDLKFTLNKCQFTSAAGSAYFYNPKLNDTTGQIPGLLPNPIRCLPRKLKVGITTASAANSIFTTGRKISEGAGGANHVGPSGFIEQVGHPATTGTSDVDITAVGVGYSTGQFSAVPLYTISGHGSGAAAIVVANTAGEVTTVNITSPGTGYVKGDVLGITTSSMTSGSGAKVTLTDVATTSDTLYLTDCQGEEFTSGQNLVYYDDAGVAVSMANTDVRVTSSVISDLYEGDVFELELYSHGMHSDTNQVVISGIEPDTIPEKLVVDVASTDNTINVGSASTTTFATFEGITTSFGYLKIGQEIMFYNSINGNGVIGVSTRGINGTVAQNHKVDDLVYRYELNGASLVGINTTHSLAPLPALVRNSKDIDKLYLKAGRNGTNDSRMTGDTQMSFTTENTVGGPKGFSSKNIQFNSVAPQFNVLTPGETNLSTQVRTVSGTSAGGAEVSFEDQGYENVELNQPNSLSSTRIVCSEINELSKLTDLPKNRSFTLSMQLSTQNADLSPIIDTQNGTVVFQRNKLNNPVANYTGESIANLSSGDTHAAIYISNQIDLKQPARSLKVLVAAHRHSSADFRVLYQLTRPDSSEVDQAYELFPGYANMTDRDGDGFGDTIISDQLNNGTSDAIVNANRDDEFSEYQFTADDLEEFTGFKIKIVSSGTDEANPPRFKDLRVLALA